MNYQDNVPIKPNTPVPTDNNTTPQLRPGHDVRASKNFRKALAERKSSQLPNENEEVINEKNEHLPSLFELSSNKKTTSKSVMNAEIQTNFQSADETTQAPKPQSFLPKEKVSEKASIYHENLTRQTQTSTPKGKELSPDPSIHNDRENVRSRENVESNVESIVSYEDKPLNEVARRKRFEIPSQPLYPDEEDMMATDELPQEPISSSTNLHVSNEAEIIPHKNRLPLETQASLSANVNTTIPVDKNSFGKTQEKGKSKEVSSKSVNSNEIESDIEVDPKTNALPLAAINSTSLTENNSIATETPPPPRGVVIRELINRVVEAIQVIKRDGLTETVVTLRNPPILEGTKLTLTTLDTSHNEFNITFSSPNAQAQIFLDHQLTKDPLAQALENRGFVIHTITTETQADIITPTQDAQQQMYGRDDGRENQQRQRRQQKEEEEA